MGLAETFAGYKMDFREDFRRERMSERELQAATWTGRVGMAARAVACCLTGGLVVQAALTADAHRARGLDGALETLATSPFGPWLLGLVALGLMVFGAYSALCARWMRVGRST